MASARRTGTNESITRYGTGEDVTLLSTWEAATDITHTTGHEEVSISNVSATRFDVGEALSFSPSGAAAVCQGTNLARTRMWYNTITGGTPTVDDDITGDTSTATADIDTIDSTNTGVTHVLEIYDTDPSFDDLIALAGSTNSATFHRIIRPGAGEGHDGTPTTGVFFLRTVASQIFAGFESDSSIQDLIVRLNINDGSSFDAISWRTLAVGIIAFDCNNAGAGVASGFSINAADAVTVDCLALDNDNNGFITFPGAGNVAYFYNCTSHGNVNNGFIAGNGDGTFINCLSDDNATDFGAAASGSDFCAASDTSDPDSGANNRVSQTFTFVDSGAADNFHLAVGDVGARGFGTNLSADAVFPFDDDVDGTLIASDQWSIGFHSPQALETADLFWQMPVVHVGRGGRA